jgi:hypothetical protein
MTSDCVLWAGSVSPEGYGYVNGKPRGKLYAHRLAYERIHGPIPVGLEIDHLCRVRHCVNPDHLEAVTRRENQLRGFGLSGVAARRTHCPKGHPYDEANTGRSKHRPNRRVCLACKREDWHRRKNRVA